MFDQAQPLDSHTQSLPPVWTKPESDPLSRQVLDHLQVGIAVLDERGAVVFCNRHARLQAEGGDVIAIGVGGRLYFPDSATQRGFHAALCQFIKDGSCGGESGVTLVFQRSRDSQPPLVVSLRVLQDGPGHILATFSDLARSPSEARMRRFMQSFGLTPAEQRLTYHLASGERLDEVAKKFGVSRHTVRNQLRAVFAKLGVQRQVDLTRLVLAGCGAAA